MVLILLDPTAFIMFSSSILIKLSNFKFCKKLLQMLWRNSIIVFQILNNFNHLL